MLSPHVPCAVQVDEDVITCISEPSSSAHTAPHVMGALTGGYTTAPTVGGLGEMGASSFPHRGGDVPTAGFTQKATMDPILEEIHVFSVSDPPTPTH